MAEQDFEIKIRTTADTSGAKQTEAELKAVSEQAYEIGRRLRLLAGAAIISGGYEFVNQLKEAATNIIKISDELDKQGAQLVKNAQKHAEQARFAQTTADIIKLGESALKDVETTHQRMLDAAGQELSIWQKIADVWAAGFRSEGPIAAGLRQKQEQATQQFEMARTSAIQDIQTAKITEARRATQSYEETVAELNQRMKEQQALADTHWLQGDIQSYLSAAGAAEKYAKELEQLKGVHDKLTDKTAKYVEGADPQVKAILANEKAMFEARAGGREQDAAMFEKSALALRAGARPDQLADVAKIYSAKEVVDALKDIGKSQREMVDLWK